MAYEETLGQVARRRAMTTAAERVPAGSRAQRVQQIDAIRRQLRSESVDVARSKKELVKAKLGEGLWADPITSKVYRIRPKVLTSWTKTSNTASAETRILITDAIPNGIEYMFSPLGESPNDRYNAPQLYGDIEDSNGSDVAGEMSVRILSPSKIEKERIWQGNPAKLSLAGDAAGLNVQTKLFFNVDTTKRAKSGDYIDATLTSASSVCTTEVTLTIECWELEEQ